jgi:hypothetical protein
MATFSQILQQEQDRLRQQRMQIANQVMQGLNNIYEQKLTMETNQAKSVQAQALEETKQANRIEVETKSLQMRHNR